MRGSVGARRRARRALLVAVGALYVASIPWYRSADAAPAVWLGLPDWVAVALVCYVAAAFANAGAWLLTEVHDGDAGEGRRGSEPAGTRPAAAPRDASGHPPGGAS